MKADSTPARSAVSRRGFVALLSAACADVSFGEGGSGLGPHRHPLVDVHHHRLLGAGTHRSVAVEELWAQAEASGVALTVVSAETAAPVQETPAKKAQDARAANEHLASLARDGRGRIGFFARLPLPDVEASLRELDHALGALQADGVLLETSYGVRWLGDPHFAPLLDELDRRQVVASVHPAGVRCARELFTYAPVAFPHQTQAEIDGMFRSLSGRGARGAGMRLLVPHAPQAGAGLTPGGAAFVYRDPAGVFRRLRA
jgi:6-methylsalicylate decarboxylase